MKKCISIIIATITVQLSIGQGIGVGTSTPNPSAALDVTSETQGMLVPRMTTAQRTAISNPANGLLVFDWQTRTFWFCMEGIWSELVDSGQVEVHRNGPYMIYTGMNDYVGIGISEPQNKLDIDGANFRDGSHATGRPLYITGEIDAASDGIEFRHGNGTQGIGFGYNTIYAAGSNADQNLGLASKGTGGSLLFQTNGSERMRITGGGNVGIGTNNPIQKFSVEGNTFISQNLGIGNSTPNAPIQLANSLANRKVVLFDGMNNDHQYYGLGINANTLRYQVAGQTDNHIFYAGTSSTMSSELMRITGWGMVGIGVNTPVANLDIARGNSPEGSLILRGTQNWSHFYWGSNEDIFIRGGKAGAHIILNEYGNLGNVGVGSGSPVQKLHVEGNTYISQKLGIGNNAPNAPIQLANSLANRKVVLWEVNNNDHQYFGLGINSNTMRYQVSGPSDSHIFYAGTSTTTSNELMRITGDGKVGIGSDAPLATLDVARGTSFDGNLILRGTSHWSHFNYGGNENTYIRGGKPGSHIFLNDLGDLGNVGIGTESPLQKLHVEGNTYVSGNVDVAGSVEMGHTIVSNSVSVPGLSSGNVTCNCPAGTLIIGGGAQCSTINNFEISNSFPNSNASWYAGGYNYGTSTKTLTAYAICARIAN